jgi:hypothetical protein
MNRRERSSVDNLLVWLLHGLGEVNSLYSLYQKNLSIKLKNTVDDVVTIGKKRNYDFQRYIERNK